MENDNKPLDVGTSFSAFAIAASIAALLALALGYYLYKNLSSETEYGELVIATGPDSGTYHALGGALQSVLQRSGKFKAVTVQSTDGSYDNMRLLQGNSEIDLAFVQSDASPSTRARLLTDLYDEVLHVLIRREISDDVQSIYDLDSRRISLGAEGSGTRELARNIIKHLNIAPSEDQIATPKQAVDALRKAELDAIFILAPMPSQLIHQLAREDAIRFLPIGSFNVEGDEAAALELVIPGVQRRLIPRSTYQRLPLKPVSTIAVSALLVARESLDAEIAREVTQTVFGYRAGETGLEGRKLVVARQIRENYDPSVSTIPYHPGAIAYYTREKPPFFVEYAEALSLGVTLLLALYSVFVAFRELLRRRMKNRVDAYLVQIEQLVQARDELDAKGLSQLRSELSALRRSAIADLVGERLLADEAYQIMQRHIGEELALISESESRLQSA
ncbi:MAG: TAXI family TRAP transporter solute-binding subunit [Halioglobus sp.]